MQNFQKVYTNRHTSVKYSGRSRRHADQGSHKLLMYLMSLFARSTARSWKSLVVKDLKGMYQRHISQFQKSLLNSKLCIVSP